MYKTILVVWVAMAFLCAGCGTSSPNPPVAHANTGYVDFYTDSNRELSWEVKRRKDSTGKFQTVYSEFEPLEGTILRLAAPPGSYEFQIWFMNLGTEGPQTVTVQVMDGKVTPVRVNLTPSGSTAVRRKEYGFRPSYKGYGHGTKVVIDEDKVFQIGAAAEAPVAYKTKEQMPYFLSQPAK